MQVDRDAEHQPHTLQFIHAIDMLSEDGLSCVATDLHRGWEDRRFSCRRSRVSAQEAIGVTIDATERDQLLLLAAYRNRIFRYPPPIQLNTKDILAAFEGLVRFVEGLQSE